jgi:hypothetical protein
MWQLSIGLKRAAAVFVSGLSSLSLVSNAQTWNGYAGDAQHTALSPVASQPLQEIHWRTRVDLSPQLLGGDLDAHYGSPIITAANTVIVPVKTGPVGGFELKAFNGANGSWMWTQNTDYSLPPTQGEFGGTTYSWTPPYGPALANSTTLYYAGAGGTVYQRGSLNSTGSVTPTQEAFYGSLAAYQANVAAYNAGVAISTPITADVQGNVYFGYQTTNTAPGGLTSGIARISAGGVGSFFQANQLMVNGSPAAMTQVVTNCAPAVSSDGSTVYVAMSSGGNFGNGRLVALNTATMTPRASAMLTDAKTGAPAQLANDGSASPTIGPDGDVYMGVLDNQGTKRGWLDHFSANLTPINAGGFGWDDTASVVPASMVKSYTGTSKYLIMTKYNNYANPETGGDGKNMIALLDPNATQIDDRNNSNESGATIMKVVQSVLGPTPDPAFDTTTLGAVHEWCINSAVVDPATDCVLVNSEDGNLYRWSLSTNTLSEQINITSGLGEAYTPTEIGTDGMVYAINDATLFAVGAIPEPSASFFLVGGLGLGLFMRRRTALSA